MAPNVKDSGSPQYEPNFYTTKPSIMKRHLIPVLFLPVVLLSCNFIQDKVRGNGTIKTETRTTGSFSRVGVGGNIDVLLKQDSSYQVKIETDENLMQHIIIRTDGDKLIIEPEDGHNLSGTKGIKVYVSAPVFEQLDASGASSFSSEGVLTAPAGMSTKLNGASDASLNLNTPKISATINGASKIIFKGQAKDLFIEANGASHAKCFELLTENADVDASGASGADIFASVSIKASASGASTVRYKGNAAVNQRSSGASSVKKVE